MSKKKIHMEPFWWTWFSAGGTAAAFTLPVLMLIFGLAVPLGWMDPPEYEELSGMLTLVTRLVILVIILLSLLHWAHRYRFTLYDGLQLQRYHKLISVSCYGAAIGLGFYSIRILLNF
jgi:fumarate reductase subunit D